MKQQVKREPTHFTLYLDIYPVWLLVSFAENQEQLGKAVRKSLKVTNFPDDWIKDDEGGKARHGGCGKMVLWCRQFPDDPTWKAVLAHEIFHIVTFVANHVGLSLSDESDEAFAYLTEYITRTIYSKLEKLEKKG